MAIFTSPTSFRIANGLRSINQARTLTSQVEYGVKDLVFNRHTASPAHPSFLHLILLVFEAVLEVICVSLPGYIAARHGMFDSDAQKLVANLNVALFTPCLVFTKLASQLTAEKLTDLAIIPLIFALQTLVSYLCSIVMSRCFRFKKRQSNFVAAMAVFGNSNSLPISLVMSLSQTLHGLHWSQVPDDNDDEVAARGILYLLIFQQLGQLVRWSWGYHVLLAPKARYGEDEPGHSIESAQAHYTDDPEQTDPDEPLLQTSDSPAVSNSGTLTRGEVDSESGSQTPVTARTYSYSKLSGMDGSERGEGNDGEGRDGNGEEQLAGGRQIMLFPGESQGLLDRSRHSARQLFGRLGRCLQNRRRTLFESFPPSVQKGLSKGSAWANRFFRGLWAFMNPPLWAMLIAILVASVPSLQRLFFDDGTFVRNSVTRAIGQNGQVAVPLILVVLGANLARNTLPNADADDMEDPKEDRKLIIASLLARMLLPTIIIAPILALLAKYVPVSILGDPIFIVVCFLLTGAPSALQLAQICQINNVYMGAMSTILFQGYVVWILPSTLVLVMCALEVVEWASAS
ncbi:hypothetical protein Egran_01376 [Elaphomyces granulatus]|uniref:Auxin efflux carrier n=1 Tax=Elaphomyces granulatus TaxID=519963 RepID=A0A232M3C7_9EURO|nr:hypothetical protein Egran_01376 [Elaphomyces granulatus]